MSFLSPRGQSDGESAPLARDGGARSMAMKEPEPNQESPMKARSLTDLPCLLLFLGYLVGMGYIMTYAHEHARLERLTNGIDFMGNVCGLSPKVVDRPFLYWCGTDASFAGYPTGLNLELPICVSACPVDASSTELCPGQPESVIVGEGDAYGTDPYDVVTTITQRVGSQPSYPTRALANRFCVPKAIVGLANSTAAVEGLMAEIHRGPMSRRFFFIAHAAGSVFDNWLFLVAIALNAILLCYIYLAFLRFFAKPLVYGCLAILSLGLIFFGAALVATANLESYQEFNPFFLHLPTDEAQLWSSVAGAVILILGALVCLAIFCLERTIQMAIACIQAACTCMFGMPALLWEPLVASILKAGIVGVLLVGLVMLAATGHVTEASMSVAGQHVHGVMREFTYDEQETNMLWAYAFGIFWVIAYCDALQNFVIVYAVVLWYYKPKGANGRKGTPWLPVCRGFITGIVFHTGSLAAGGFIIAVTSLLSLVMSLIAKQAEDTGNKTLTCMATCCACVIQCFKQALEHLNKNAYIDIAINSNWFCTAALNAFHFITREAAVIGLLNGACFVFSLLGVLVNTGLCSYIAYIAVTRAPQWAEVESPSYIEEPVPITIVAGLIAAIISSVFMLVVDQTADTLLYVYADNIRQDRGASADTVHLYAPNSLSGLIEDHAHLDGKD